MKEPEVLVIDDDQRILKLIKATLATQFEVIVTQNVSEGLELLQQHDIKVVVSDLKMPEINGAELLKIVKEKSPLSRRVLLSGKLDLDNVIQSINHGETHKVLKKPWNSHELISEIRSQILSYNNIVQEKRDYLDLKGKYQDLSNQMPVKSDELSDLLINLSNIDEFNDFPNQFIKAIEGMRSLIAMNLEIFLSGVADCETYLHSGLNYISDLEALSNQYDQKLLKFYLFLLRSYIKLLEDDYHSALSNISDAQSVYHWYDHRTIPKGLVKHYHDFPLQNEQSYDKTNEIEKRDLDSSKIKTRIFDLLQLNIENVIDISDTLLKYVSRQPTELVYLIIIDDGLPVYDYQGENVTYELPLISGFFVALSQFLQEISNGSGDINKIKHDAGVILVHAIEKVKYILMVTTDDIHFRVGLRQFANLTYDFIKKNPVNYIISGEDKTFLDNQISSIFKVDFSK